MNKTEPIVLTHLTDNWLEIIPNMVLCAKRTNYAKTGAFKKGRIPEFEPFIVLSPVDAANYSNSVICGPWPEAEESISTSPEASILYAKKVIKGKWEKGEQAISTDSKHSFDYARLLECPFPLGENSISKDAQLSFKYANEILKERFIKGEEAIAKHDLNNNRFYPHSKERYKLSISYYNTFKNYHTPWTEEQLRLSPCWMYLYAKEELKGRLPDSLHNAMMLFGLRYKEDYYVKKYLGAKKYTKKVKRRTKKRTLDIAAEIIDNFSSKE